MRRALKELRSDVIVDWDERKGRTSVYRVITPDEIDSPDQAVSPDCLDAEPRPSSSETPDQNALRTDKQINKQNDDFDESIKEEQNEPRLLREANDFLKQVGLGSTVREELVLANPSLVMTWSQVDWKRDYPRIQNPPAFLTAAIRNGDEPILRLPASPRTNRTFDRLTKQNQEIVLAAWDVMRHRYHGGFEQFVEDGSVAVSTLEQITTAEEVSELLAFAEGRECRNTEFELIGSLRYLARVWSNLKRHYNDRNKTPQVAIEKNGHAA